jgi:hypothetical protein
MERSPNKSGTQIIMIIADFFLLNEPFLWGFPGIYPAGQEGCVNHEGQEGSAKLKIQNSKFQGPKFKSQDRKNK